MTVSEWTQVLTAGTAFVGAIASVLAVIRIQVVHKATNSIVTTMLIEGKSAAHAEGVAAGLQQGRDEIRNGHTEERIV